MTSSTGNVGLRCPSTFEDDCVRRLLKCALRDQFKVVGTYAGQPEAVIWGAWSSYFHTRVAADCGLLSSVFLNTYSHIFKPDAVTGEIRVQLALKLCTNGHCSAEKGCEDLHYCRFVLFGPRSCKNGDACRFGHDLTTDHNVRLLRHYRLDELTAAEVSRLLRISGAAEPAPVAAGSLTSRPTRSLPKICSFYNGKKGCQRGAQCWDLHVCWHHVQGTCIFKAKCKNSHDLYSGQPGAVLRSRGVNLGRPQEDLILELRAAMNAAAASGDKVTQPDKLGAIDPSIAATQLAGRPVSRSGDSGPSTAAVLKPTPPNDPVVSSSNSPQKPSATSSISTDIQKKPKICIFHLRGLCRFGVDCNKFHADQRVSFQWQWTAYVEDCTTIIWNSFDRKVNWKIEKYFSLPENDSAETVDDAGRAFVIDFNSRTVSGDLIGNVRRLGTDSVNSQVYPSRSFATLWKWYWQSSHGKWTSCENSDDIELEYKAKRLEHHPPAKEYWMDIGKMRYFETTGARAGNRLLKRRPFFYGSAKELKNSSCKFELASNNESVGDEIALVDHGVAVSRLMRSLSTACVSFPTNWSQLDDRQQEQHGFQLVDVQKDGATTAEFETIRQLFAATLPNEAIRSLKRIQNVELFEDFSRFRAKLEKKRGGKDPVAVRRLFHGTAPKYVDAICQQGFDWRLSGTSAGTVYGKGSYFARDAKYSMSYCQGGDRIFVVQVIVGDFTLGRSTYTRPPSKDATLPLHVQDLYDSCVNDPSNPAIFVVFDRHQAYPEYIIEFDRQTPVSLSNRFMHNNRIRP